MNESFVPVPPSGESVEFNTVKQAKQLVPSLCPMCHQAVLPEFYFCPNCGKNLREKPLSTSLSSQISIYLLSIVTPPLCFLTIGYWHGMKYLKSKDPKAKEIGIISIVLMTLSTIGAIWLMYFFTVQITQTLTGGLLGGSGSELNF